MPTAHSIYAWSSQTGIMPWHLIWPSSILSSCIKSVLSFSHIIAMTLHWPYGTQPVPCDFPYNLTRSNSSTISDQGIQPHRVHIYLCTADHRTYTPCFWWGSCELATIIQVYAIIVYRYSVEVNSETNAMDQRSNWRVSETASIFNISFWGVSNLMHPFFHNKSIRTYLCLSCPYIDPGTLRIKKALTERTQSMIRTCDPECLGSVSLLGSPWC